ncbi:hypothetical protein BJH93_02855 [Kocuria polaris]|nr:hypothetical protein [Kocuria polaris]
MEANLHDETDRTSLPLRGRARWATGAIGVAIGLGAGLLSLTPWLLTGGTLPLQNLWAVPTMPEDMPFSLLPLSQYELVNLVSLLISGGATAALVFLVWRPARRRAAFWAVASGLASAQLITVVQSFLVLHAGLGLGPGAHRFAEIYFYGMLFGVLATVIVSLAVYWLLTSRSPNKIAVGAAVGAPPVAWWLFSWLDLTLAGLLVPFSIFQLWLPAVAVGVALARLEWRSLRGGFAWALSLAVLWVSGPMAWAVMRVASSRAEVGRPGQFEAGLEALSVNLIEQLPAVAVALAVGIAGAAQCRRRFTGGDRDPAGRVSSE